MTPPNYTCDDAKYSFFHCERWRLERRNLEAKIDACTIENWNSMDNYTQALLKSKKFDFYERIRMGV